MDIHPPHHPIRSVRDFLLQIFTVTCGIIIALGLEAVVTSRNDAALARAARADFRAELTQNSEKIGAQLPGLQSDFNWMLATIAYGEARLRHESVKEPPRPPGSRNFVALANAAWDTALATQAMHQLRFDEARALADAYTAQTALRDLTLRAEEQWISVAALDSNPDAMTEPDMRTALGVLRVSAAYAGSLLALERRVVDREKVALAALR